MMKRYIDAELIQKLKHKCIAKYPLSYADGIFALAKEIADIPTADVVEVVKCGKCKHWLNTGYDPLIERRYGNCYNTETPFQCESRPCTSENDFCSYGERRMDNETL